MSETRKNLRDFTRLAKRLSIASLLSFFASQVLAGPPEAFRVGPVYTEKPGELAVVVELPPGAAPKESDFSLFIDRKPVAVGRGIKSFEESGKGLSLLLCVDVSGSMKGGPLDETREALLSFLGAAEERPQDRFSLISFADEAYVESPFNNPREQLEDKVGNMHAMGNRTSLYHAIYKALSTFKGPALPQRRRVIVISDGKDEGSTETLENVTTKSNTLGIPVDTIGRGKIEKQYLDVLRGLSKNTGGKFIEARPDLLSLQDAIVRLYRDLRETSSFVVDFAYATEESGGKTGNARIELMRLGGKPLSATVPGVIPLSASGIEKKWPYWSIILTVIGVMALSLGFMFWRRNKCIGRGYVEEKPIGAGNREEPATQPSRAKTFVGVYQFSLPGTGRPAAVLTGVAGSMAGKRFEVNREFFRIGADPENDLSIAEDEFVSSNHAYLRYQEGSLFVFDDSSLNGTFVNHERVGSIAKPLRPGDRLRVGRTAFEVEAYSG